MTMPLHFFGIAALAALLISPNALAQSSHAKIISSWDDQSFARGKQLYESLCITCHGSPEKEGTLPTSRPFWKEPFKNGNDPYSIYRTLSQGFGQMPAWTSDSAATVRCRSLHSRAFVVSYNPAAYFKVNAAYLATLPTAPIENSNSSDAPTEKEPPSVPMDFGPALFWTLQVESTTSLTKASRSGRLHDGPGGVSKGHAWMLSITIPCALPPPGQATSSSTGAASPSMARTAPTPALLATKHS